MQVMDAQQQQGSRGGSGAPAEEATAPVASASSPMARQQPRLPHKQSAVPQKQPAVLQQQPPVAQQQPPVPQQQQAQGNDLLLPGFENSHMPAGWVTYVPHDFMKEKLDLNTHTDQSLTPWKCQCYWMVNHTDCCVIFRSADTPQPGTTKASENAAMLKQMGWL